MKTLQNEKNPIDINDFQHITLLLIRGELLDDLRAREIENQICW